MSNFPTTHTVGHRVRSEGVAGYGGVPEESWAAAVDVAVTAVYPGVPGVDYEPGRTSSEIPLFMLGPADSIGSVAARDRMVWQGSEYTVDGEPENYNYGPHGYTPGIRLRLLRVEG